MSGTTKIGQAIRRDFKILEPEILHEDYSVTVDFGRELSEPYTTQLKRKGFEITQESKTIYTLTYENNI